MNEENNSIKKIDKDLMEKKVKTSIKKDENKENHIIIIGATSGAHTSAFYSATANIDFITIMLPFKLGNFLEKDIETIDFAGNINGDLYPSMFDKTKKQCERFNCKIYNDDSLKIKFNKKDNLFIVEGNKIPLFSSKWLLYEKMDNIEFDDNVLKNNKSIEIEFSNDFSQLCANGCIAFKKYQVRV